jgi:two-component system, OmpR family, alkaline phosphatase synthesis response regulator PhoP
MSSNVTDAKRSVSRKILIAEDETAILLSLEFLLRAEGYEVVTAEDGLDALNKAESIRPDLLVLDLMMPRADGFEICRRIRENPVLRHVRILVLSARGLEADIARAYAAGADDYMMKPFATRELVAKAAALLSGTGRAPDPQAKA